jgi:ribosomal-protein-serine acetyltransferase
MTAIVPRTELVGRRVVLRPNAPSFAPLLSAAARESLATVGRWMPWCHADRTEQDSVDWYRACERHWDADTEYEFSAFAVSGEYVGAAGLNQFNRVHNFANLGYWVRESWQGRGVAAEAVRLLAEFGFRVLELDRIEIVVAAENLSSRRVAEKAGACYEGIARRRILLRDQVLDAAMYSLVPNGGS